MLLETMVDVGWWVDCCGGKIFFNFLSGTRHRQRRFCTFKKSAQNQDQNLNQKKETRKSPFFNFIAFVLVVICSRCHL
jgi:hypothetical protein